MELVKYTGKNDQDMEVEHQKEREVVFEYDTIISFEIFF